MRAILIATMLLALPTASHSQDGAAPDRCGAYQRAQNASLVYVEGRLLAITTQPGPVGECMPASGLTHDIAACTKEHANPHVLLWLTIQNNLMAIRSKDNTVPVIVYLREQEAKVLRSTLVAGDTYGLCGSIRYPEPQGSEFAVPVVVAIETSLTTIQ